MQLTTGKVSFISSFAHFARSSYCIVSRARLSPHPRGGESGQIPITISFLTRQKLLGVLIGCLTDVTSERVRLPIQYTLMAACCCLCRDPVKFYYTHLPIMCWHPLSYSLYCWLCNTKAIWEFDRGGRYQVFSVRYNTEYFTFDTVDTILFSIRYSIKVKHQYRTNM